MAGPQEKRLRAVLQPASRAQIIEARAKWELGATKLAAVAEAIKGARPLAQENLGNETAPAADAAFAAMYDKVKRREQQMRDGAVALTNALDALGRAETVRDGFDAAGALDAPTPPPWSDDEVQQIQQMKIHNARTNLYNNQVEAREEAARLALEDMDETNRGSAATLRKIQGEAPADDRDTPTTTPPGPGHTPGRHPGRPGDDDHDRDRGGWVGGEPRDRDDDDRDQDKDRDRDRDEEEEKEKETDTEKEETEEEETDDDDRDDHTDDTVGTPQGPTGSVTPIGSPSGGHLGSGSATGGALGGAAGAMGGVAGGALGLGALRGGGGHAAASGGGATSGSSRPIGSSARTAASGALGRSTTAGQARGAGTGAAARATGAGAGGRGAAGGRGTGAAGAGGGRGGRRSRDEKPAQVDHLVDDQDWIEDDDAAPGVIG